MTSKPIAQPTALTDELLSIARAAHGLPETPDTERRLSHLIALCNSGEHSANPKDYLREIRGAVYRLLAEQATVAS